MKDESMRILTCAFYGVVGVSLAVAAVCAVKLMAGKQKTEDCSSFKKDISTTGDMIYVNAMGMLDDLKKSRAEIISRFSSKN